MPEWQKQGLSDSEAWGISRDGSHFWIFAMHHRSRPVRVLRVNSSWTQGDIYLNQSVPKIESTFPLEPPLGELFYNHWAANREGLILHGATLVKDGIGIIAMGHSGAGKSTLSRLWADQFGPESVLTDAGYLLLANFLRMAGLAAADIPDIAAERPAVALGRQAEPKGPIPF